MKAMLTALGVSMLFLLNTVVRLAIEKEYFSWSPVLARHLVRVAGWLHPRRRQEWLADVFWLQTQQETGLWEAAVYLAGAPWLTLRRFGLRLATGNSLILGMSYVLTYILIYGLAEGLNSFSRQFTSLSYGLVVALALCLATLLAILLATRLATRLTYGLRAGLIVSLSVAFVYGVPLGFAVDPRQGLVIALYQGLGAGLAAGVSAGLIYALSSDPKKEEHVLDMCDRIPAAILLAFSGEVEAWGGSEERTSSSSTAS